MRLFLDTIIVFTFICEITTSSIIHSPLPQRVVTHYEWSRSVNITSWYKEWEICLLNKNESDIVTNFKNDAINCVKKKKKVTFRCNVGNTYYCKWKSYMNLFTCF
jgi:hypothetical protein